MESSEDSGTVKLVSFQGAQGSCRKAIGGRKISLKHEVWRYGKAKLRYLIWVTIIPIAMC